MRATDDAELHTRVQTFVPTFRDIVAALDARLLPTGALDFSY
jgi:hypothetical protein